MGSFGIGTNADAVDSGPLKGRQVKIACKAWFTSDGSIRPLSFKFEGDDGVIRTVDHVTVRLSEEKNYSGIPSKEYVCRAVMGGLTQEFKLIFYPEDGRWVMVVPEFR